MAGDQLDDDDTIDDPEQLLKRVRRRARGQLSDDDTDQPDTGGSAGAPPASASGISDSSGRDDTTVASGDISSRDPGPPIAPQSPPDKTGSAEAVSGANRRGRWVIIAAMASIGLIAAFAAGVLLDRRGDSSGETLRSVAPAAPANRAAPPSTAPIEEVAPTTSAAPPTTQSVRDDSRDAEAGDEASTVDDSGTSAPTSNAAPVPTTSPAGDIDAERATDDRQDTTASDEPPPVVPSQPSLTVQGGRRTVTASWSADDNGSRVLEWQVNDGGLAGGPASDATEFVWKNAHVGSYAILVRARNAAGWSEWSAESIVGVYDVPSQPALTVEGGPRTVTANWSASDNGSRISEWQVNDGRLPGGPGAGETSYTWSNAQIGSHTLRVRARNEAGWGQWSRDYRVEVADVIPSMRSVNVTGGVNRIQASWSATGNVTRWEVDDDGLPGGPSAQSVSYTWNDVPSGSYVISVRACNTAGCSSQAGRQVEVTDPPRSVTVAQGDARRVDGECTGRDCAFLKVTLKGFSPGTFSIECRHREWPQLGWVHQTYFEYTTTQTISQYCVMGVPGITVYVRVIDSDGRVVKSNELVWPRVSS